MVEHIGSCSQPIALRAGFHYFQSALHEDVVELSKCTEKLTMPVHARGGEGFMVQLLPVWQRAAEHIKGGLLDRGGHFVAEERAVFVIEQVQEFFYAG